MQINFSDYVASIALLFSIGSAYYAKKQVEFARISARNDYRSHLSENHKKYYLSLQSVEKKHAEDISSLTAIAGEALSDIVHLFDKYDVGDGEVRRLRHLIHEASEIAYCTVKGQFGWQTGSNISHRFYQFLRLEDNLDPQKNYFGKDEDSHRQFLQEAYRTNRYAYLESDILKDHYFASLIRQAKNRIDRERIFELLTEIQAAFYPFSDTYSKLKPSFQDSADQLEQLLKDGEMEHFHLAESPQIHHAIKYRRATLDVLGHLLMPDLDKDYACYNFTSRSIYACALLHAIQNFHDWGWHEYY